MLAPSCSPYCSPQHQALPSFPTRRSSDLGLSPVRSPCRSESRCRRDRRRTRAGPRPAREAALAEDRLALDRKSTRLNSSHVESSYAVFCLKKKKSAAEYDMTQLHSAYILD